MEGKLIEITDRREPLISIVTVCLNAAEHIERCIQSVLGQTYANIEYTIIDGGSTDGTLRIIKKYENRITNWVSEKDRGIYDAMNKGIAMCKGKYIGLLNSDDYYSSDAVQTVVNAISEDDPIDILHGNTMVMAPKGSYISKGNHDDLLRNWAVKHPTCFIKSEIYRSFKYDDTIKISADYDLLLQLSVEGKHFKHVDQLLTHFSPFGISSRPSWSAVLERYHIRAKYNTSVALIMFLKEAVLHCDELFYAYSVNNECKQNMRNRLLGIAKSFIRPFFLFIKKSMLNQ